MPFPYSGRDGIPPLDLESARRGDYSAIADSLNALWLGVNSARTDRTRTQAQFQWKDVPFNANDFTASTGTWTVDSTDFGHYKYVLAGDMLFLSVSLGATSTSAVGAELRIRLPAGLTFSGHTLGFSAFTGSAFVIVDAISEFARSSGLNNSVNWTFTRNTAAGNWGTITALDVHASLVAQVKRA